MASNDEPGCAQIIVISCVVIVMFGVLGYAWYEGGRQNGVNEQRKEAVEAGVGKWTVDEKTGEKTFKYGK